MDSPIQSSFIPQDATRMSATINRGSGGLGELLLLISIVFLVASGALAGGVYLYKQYLETVRTQKVNNLTRAKAQFEPSLIDQLTRLNVRMQAAQSVLSGHLAPSALFQALESTTLSTVSFRDLNLTSTDPQHILVRMNGVAQSVNSIALQAETFSKSSVITDPIFTAISRQPDGVHFEFNGTVNPAAMSYVQIISGAQAPAQQPVVQQPVQPSTVFSGPSVSKTQSATNSSAPPAASPPAGASQ